ncbi:a7a00d74-23ed-40b3-b396-66e89ef3a581 [Thermothielavioides terrestris]|uniref:Ubiquitin-like protease family profile domain-containing protein n=2 Tax=Thermothielavioides terrestris TaxID=2587410 RepID=G2QTB9_THETT|nr:uncharacterized protein THITE_2107246 [Thermothielavioides terrestris NRRL 8126]AEO62736.1 hypothetical protein THITE_2107246 [Thermothielavioides terrestris NRRL 8126]SPQ21771.1 a7a00d74-23ed-40b3-b396-66e89ef3a581 [Thermothielavioides terrestris]
MPPPFPRKPFAPRTHLDTLNSGPSSSPAVQQTGTTDAPTQPSPPKRQKLYTSARLIVPDEEIIDIDQDVTSRTERHESQSSLVHSGSPGVSEFQTVEALSQSNPGRSNRRSRRSQAGRPANMTELTRQAGRFDTPELIESFDELAPAQKPAPGRQRTARLVSAAGTRPSTLVRDPADEFILGKSTQTGKQSHGLTQGKKRPRCEIADDRDELGEESNSKGASQASTRPSNEDSPRHGAPSLSRRGDINATRWENKQGTRAAAMGVRVEAAVCQPNLRYAASEGQGSCFLRQAEGAELLAFTEDGKLAEPHRWLKITGKAKTLTYHPQSNYIKVTQSMDQASSTPIGGLMILQLSSNADASWVAGRAGKSLGIQVLQERESRKLGVMFEKANQDVARARMASSGTKLSDDAPDPAPQTIEKFETANIVRSNSRPLIRHQMQASAKDQNSSSSRVEPMDARISSGSHSLRTRQIAGSVQRAMTPLEPVIRRWSQENPQWSENWKIPLVFNRTTVNKEDIPRLDEGECLNDNLIGFGLRYLFDKFGSRHQDLNKRVYLHNSFFYEKLKAGRGAINYDGVKSWTAKVDLLSYDYIVVPVNEHFHWWVAIICNPGKLDPDWRGTSDKTEGGASSGIASRADRESSDEEMTDGFEKRPTDAPSEAAPTEEPILVTSDIVDLDSRDMNSGKNSSSNAGENQTRKPKAGTRTYRLEDPRIITLDSLGSSHPQAIAHLKKYLLAEFEHKRNKVISNTPPQLGMRANNIPEQNNFCDCGVYLLGYIQEFVKDPDRFIQTLLQKERPDWEFSPSALRALWRDTILFDQKMYQKEQLKEKRKRREASAAKSTPKGSAEPSSNPSREASEIANSSTSMQTARDDSPERPASTTTAAACGTEIEPAPRDQRDTVSAHSPSTASAPIRVSPKQSPRQDGCVDDVVPNPPKEDIAILPSIESPEVEAVPRSSPERRDDPHFIEQLSSSSSAESDEDGDHIAEVDAKSFYKSTPARSTNQGRKRTTLSSPAVGRQQPRGQLVKTRAAHTGSLFVLDGTRKLSSSPVVAKAELVRHSDHIDLT